MSAAPIGLMPALRRFSKGIPWFSSSAHPLAVKGGRKITIYLPSGAKEPPASKKLASTAWRLESLISQIEMHVVGCNRRLYHGGAPVSQKVICRMQAQGFLDELELRT